MPIVMSKEEWARIGRWTDTDREDKETVRRSEYVRYLETTSKDMTKDWPNSVENVNKRNEELRRARIDVAEKANSKFYKRYLKRQKEEQERMMYSARDMVFKNKDAPKMMLSAVIETCIQKERLEQVKFLRELRHQNAVQKRKDDDEVIEKAKEWEQLLATKKKLQFEANKQHQKDIVDQAHEISERNRKEYEEELNMQKLDNIKADQQTAALKEFEENFKVEEKARIWADMEQAKRESETRRAEQAARNLMDNRLLDVLLKSQARVERQRKQTEKDVKAAKQRVLDQISAKLESGDAVREAKDQAILNKAIQEKDDIAAARREKQEWRRAAGRRERADARAQWERDEAQRLQEFNNKRQWECMNRFKNLELYEDYKEKMRQENERKVKEFREDTLRLWKERTEKEARELAETRYFYGELTEQQARAADARVLRHAAGLLREARARARPDRALRQAVDRYCKLHRLYPMPGLPASLADHFQEYAPFDGSKPPAPARPRGGPQDAAAPAHTGRNGLNEPAAVTTFKTSNEKQKEESVEDYKRANRANGLQRRPAQHELTLPPIAVTPCQAEGAAANSTNKTTA